MKLLITGVNGFVGGSLLAQAPEDWVVHGIGRTKQPDLPPQSHPGRENHFFYHGLDLLDTPALDTLLRSIKPDAVIHAAAIANIDFCEHNRETAEAVNVGVTKHIAGICQEINAKLIFCSTDTVFDGQKGFYTEEDLPVPINYYASTKVRAEQIVLDTCKSGIVARLSLVVGLPVRGRGNSFLADMRDKLQKGETLSFPDNEIRTPVDVLTLGAALLELAAGGYGGLLHLAGNTRIDRYQMARSITDKLGFAQTHIHPVNSNTLPGRAPRPADVSLDNRRARALLKTPMLSLEEGLELILKTQ